MFAQNFSRKILTYPDESLALSCQMLFMLTAVPRALMARGGAYGFVVALTNCAFEFQVRKRGFSFAGFTSAAAAI